MFLFMYWLVLRYTWDVTKCMFSTGNISEKLRIASLDCSEETVVDLYAGIGYFVLPYLVHAKARHVHACEWNPHAIQALRKSLALNGVQDRCTIHEGDNRKVRMEFSYPYQELHLVLGQSVYTYHSILLYFCFTYYIPCH